MEAQGKSTCAVVPSWILHASPSRIESQEFGTVVIAERELTPNQTLDLGKIQFGLPSAIEVSIHVVGGYCVAAMHTIGIDVVAGRTERVEVTVPVGVERAFVLPPVPFDRFLTHKIWRDSDGQGVDEILGNSNKRSEPWRLTCPFVPGHYSVEVFGRGDQGVPHEFTMTARSTSDPIIELTRPR